MSEQEIDRADIRRIIAESKAPAATGHQGALYVGEVDGRGIIVKAAHGNPLAAWIRRRMLAREYRVYRRLEGVAGVPRCFGFHDGRYLAIEAIHGQTLRSAVIEDRDRFYGLLFEIIDAMHARGVAHGDLTRRDNILVDAEQRPVLVDFGVSTIYRRGFHPLNRLAFRFFAQHDLNAWLKYKYDRHWDLMSAEDARHYRRLRIDDLARHIKRAWSTLHGGAS